MAISSAALTSGLTEIFRSAPSAAELATFQSICDSQGVDAAYAAAADSAGADDARTVVSFYQVFYGRQPDDGGLTFWTGELESGNVSLNELATAFADASEFNERFGNRTSTEIVFAQYRNVLGREPDFEGLQYWTGQVNDGNLTLADLGRFFATSDEADARFDPFIDDLLVNAANGQSPDSGDSLFDTVSAGGVTIDAGTGDLTSASVVTGSASANDVLAVFNDGQGNAVSPQMTGVETVVWTEQTNDRNSNADNNVGGYSNGRSVEVDVELDAGRIEGVTRWEDFDSRADLVIEDARDNDDIDGTFTGDLTAAMVSTDPGNVDYAIYFDGPVNTSDNESSVSIQVIDQNNSQAFSSAQINGNTQGNLTDAQLVNFAIMYNGQRITVDMGANPANAPFFGAGATYNNLVAAINAALDNTTLPDGSSLGADVTATLNGSFFENIGNDNNGAGNNAQVFGLEIVLESASGVTLAEGGGADITVVSSIDPSDTAASLTTASQNIVELIRLNVDLDDVGKGSMGGDFLAGAMSTGRQDFDDGTSDSQGIQQFDIKVDRSSQLQTINSTNNALEVVNIENGSNGGPNNTTTASDDFENPNSTFGDLVVRGRANPDGNIATDNPMPGAVPQHDDFGFNDVRTIDASRMNGSVDLTVDLSTEIVEKYLDVDDGNQSGNTDDVNFTYLLGSDNDELFLNASDAAVLDAGTASREDFNLAVSGNAGNDSIVVNVGQANKRIDGQGQDYYTMSQLNGQAWYANQVANEAASISVRGNDGNDSIWTHGWGDAQIIAGNGEDVVYTDNSGTASLPALALNNLSRNINEHEQIDYEIGAAWTFNDDNADNGFIRDIQGSTNSTLAVATPTASRSAGTVYETLVTVSFFGANGDAGTAYTSTVTIPNSVIAANGSITEQQLNQAIKDAVNTDSNGVLNKVLEAVDGPGQSLAVYSKIDGDFDRDDLQISIVEERTTGGTTTTATFDLDDTSYDTSDAADVDFQNFGGASMAESDNTIVIDADGARDVTVLSTNDVDNGSNGPNLNDASNELLVFQTGGNFGTETIFNFDAGDGDASDFNGEDRFLFREIDYTPGTGADFSNGAINTANDSVSIVAEDTTNNTQGKVADFFDGAATSGNTEHIVIVYDADDNNTGTVYLVQDTASSAATPVTLGEIELIGTDWADLTFDNFL